ncbi:MAG: heavy metal-binding domain-containing protein [Liquorilactobacillus nagelii]|jgi:uncharacterized protein YbjQ (UPF0145 family)|uniref:heavy metal-binding domain-containing protein n=1 Tax=Liquorilactobacillus nagelii TaxID=82688 RepID=UPI00242CEF33|nr:heavy metal-binding domain-containing protein [Liquorilactobacillus nagelii]MCI1921195.1 heavy metal-binding domain-containing protein [Liquorilactobacillus nagelii]MCI1975926.1 heavy metal-binding domain-containing protein [Liquorilactobacillus nagelii]
MKSILIVTTENIPGKKYQALGKVFGVTTQSKNVLRNIGAGLKNIAGGEIKDYTKMLEESRQDMQSVVACGTAVKYLSE